VSRWRGGGLGAHHTRLSQRLLLEADVVLGLGCRFERFPVRFDCDGLTERRERARRISSLERGKTSG